MHAFTLECIQKQTLTYSKWHLMLKKQVLTKPSFFRSSNHLIHTQPSPKSCTEFPMMFAQRTVLVVACYFCLHPPHSNGFALNFHQPITMCHENVLFVWLTCDRALCSLKNVFIFPNKYVTSLFSAVVSNHPRMVRVSVFVWADAVLPLPYIWFHLPSRGFVRAKNQIVLKIKLLPRVFSDGLTCVWMTGSSSTRPGQKACAISMCTDIIQFVLSNFIAKTYAHAGPV